MKIEVTDSTTLPTWLQGHVSDGHLDLGALAAPEDVSGLKTALSKERGNAAAYSKYGTPDEIDAKFAYLTEKAKGNGKGADDAQAKLDAMKADHDTQNAAKDARYNTLLQRNAGSEFKAELAKAGFIAESIDDIASSAMGRLQFNEDGSPKVMTSDGKPMIGSGADHGATLADLAKELATSKSYAVRDAGKGGGGKPAGSTGGTPDKPTVTRATFDAMSQGERAAHAKSGGAVKD
tara:strand:- start:832 stop:1536 length:705 start_codon:yes stop_codon:yes gene_type:complete